MSPSTSAKTRGYLYLLPAWVDTLSLLQVIDAYRVALQCFEEGSDLVDQALVKGGLGRFLLKRDPQSEEGQRYLEEALVLARRSQNEWVLFVVEVGACANAAYEQKDFVRAESLYRKGVIRSHERRDLDNVTVISHVLATVLMQQLRFEEALPFLEESYQAAQQINDPLFEMFTQSHRALAVFHLGDRATARTLAETARETSRETLPDRHRKLALLTASRILNEVGEYPAANAMAHEVIRITQRHVGMTLGWYAAILDVVACIASGKSRFVQAVRLFGAAETDYEYVHLAAVMLEANQLDAFNGHRAVYNEYGNAPYIAKARAALGEAAYATAYAAGRAMPLAQAIDYALDLADPKP
jgi:tetratricopeptide (TPR) repeat protein